MCLSGHKRFPLGSTNPEIVQTGLKVTQRAIELAGRLGTRVIQIPAFDVYETETRTEETQKRYVDNLYKVARMAEHACVTMAIEPVEENLLACLLYTSYI